MYTTGRDLFLHDTISNAWIIVLFAVSAVVVGTFCWYVYAVMHVAFLARRFVASP